MTYETPSGDVVTGVIAILKRFSHHATDDPAQEAEVFKHHTREKLNAFISENREISLVLPAFPWKNRNLDKVLGPHPDLGEELGLARLNHLCKDIKKVYTFGARVNLIADGPVYNDLVGIPDEEYYEYGNELRDLASRKEFRFIRFFRLSDLLRDDGSVNDLSKEAYLSLVPSLRARLEQEFLGPDFDVDQEIRSNEDTKITYDGYVRLAEEDLKWGANMDEKILLNPISYRIAAEDVAKGMIRRLIAYENLLREKYADGIRLSIHPSTGKSKISVPLLPHDNNSRGTPWHSSVAVLASGRIQTGHSKDFRKEFELVKKDGKPYYFREKNDLFELEAAIAIDYEYEGLVLKYTGSSPLTLSKKDEDKLAGLILKFKTVRAVGFELSAINML